MPLSKAAWTTLAVAAALMACAVVRAVRASRVAAARSTLEPAGAPAAASSAPAEVPDGDWTCRMDTPLGEQTVALTLAAEGDVLTGRADTPFGPYALTDGRARDGELTWRIPVTRPMEVELRFRATVEGDTLDGVVDAGPLGEQAFTGTRTASP